jgi:outer membrane protein TolC
MSVLKFGSVRLTGVVLLAWVTAPVTAVAPPDFPMLPPRTAPATPAGNGPTELTAAPARGVPAPGALPLLAPQPLPAPRALPPQPTTAGPQPACPAGTPIDLAAALRLAGVENPEILIARTRVVEAVAVRQLAAAQILPSLNLGLNYDAHTGPVMQSSGNILKVNRTALYLGAGANAVAAGTVNIPGLVYNLNVSDAIFGALVTRQLVERARLTSLAVRNDVFRRVALAYTELLGAEGRRSIALQIRDEAAEVARITAVFAKAGQVAQADADRAATERERRQSDLVEADNELLLASARLAELLGLDRSTRLHVVEERVVPTPVVPEQIPLCQLLAVALMQRPELAEKRVAVRQALLTLSGAKLLPFSPNVIVGFSAGTFGGGSGLVSGPQAPRFGVEPQPRFGNFGPRNDFDAVMYWTLQNLGVGNLALVRVARSRVGVAELEQLKVLNQVRREVADAYLRTHIRFAQLALTEEAVRAGDRAFRQDFRRIEGNVGRPIELLASLRLLAQSRYDYLRAIVLYNEAQFELYVALGQPPADVLARPVPTDFRAPLPAPEGKGP